MASPSAPAHDAAPVHGQTAIPGSCVIETSPFVVSLNELIHKHCGAIRKTDFTELNPVHNTFRHFLTLTILRPRVLTPRSCPPPPPRRRRLQ